MLELPAPSRGQLEVSLPPVLTGKASHPTFSQQGPQSAAQRGAIQGQKFAQPSLRQAAGELQGLKEGKLRHSQSRPPQFLIVELRNRPRCAAQSGAGTRQRHEWRLAWRWLLAAHILLYMHISCACQE